jgi:hypothetical protein
VVVLTMTIIRYGLVITVVVLCAISIAGAIAWSDPASAVCLPHEPRPACEADYLNSGVTRELLILWSAAALTGVYFLLDYKGYFRVHDND